LRETLRTALELVFALGIAVAQAAFVFFLVAVLARALRRAIRRWLQPALAPGNVKRLVENLVTFALYGVGATILLTYWGVTWSTLLTAIGLSTILVALGLQSMLQSLIGGLFILFERPFSVGDHISYSVHRVSGTVEEIALRTTVVRDEEGARVVVPNSLALTNAIINNSPERAVLTIVRVSGAGGDGRTAEETCALAESALAGITWPKTSPEITVSSRLHWFRLPRLLVRIPRLGPWLDSRVRTLIDDSTQVRVTWTGVNDPEKRKRVQDRLGERFPHSRITVRRW
jgi:hypothetical protein